MARDLVANPPKYGPRTTLRTQSAAPAAPVVEEFARELGITFFEVPVAIAARTASPVSRTWSSGTVSATRARTAYAA